jgi:fatty acid amide hydrolase 2
VRSDPLTHRSARALAAAIAAGEVSARDVVEAHIAALERVQPIVRPLAMERFAAARAEADAADARVAQGGELPPLLGVPCTIKESIAVAGMPNSAGLVARREYRSERDATAVARVRGAGAIVLGVTNVSELTLWIESENRLYGRTRNAYDPRRIAGGSSGGEGAAVGSGTVPFGIGTDFGGSIRLPAFFNGVFGHKPSPGLVPVTGQYPDARGDSARMLGLGPLTRRAEDLYPLLRLIAGPDGVDPLVRGQVELRDPAAVDLGRLDVILSEGASVLPVRRELREARERAAEALARRGALVRHERLSGLRRAIELYLSAVASGAGVTVAELLREAGADPLRPRTYLRRGGPHTVALRLTALVDTSPKWMLMRRARQARAAADALAGELAGILGEGVLLHPPFPRVAPRHGGTVGRPWLLAHAAAFNLLGLPATAIPLGLGRAGVPLGVQAVAVPGNDHVCLAVAAALEDALGGWVPPGRA